jgi:hypothetical protein
MKPIFIPLFREFYEAYIRGAKSFELRGVTPVFNSTRIKSGIDVIISCGYGHNHRRNALIGAVYLYNSMSKVKSSSIYDEIIPQYLQGSNVDDFLKTYDSKYKYFIAFEIILKEKVV